MKGSLRATCVCCMALAFVGGAAAQSPPAAPARADGWVVIPVEEYRALRSKAYPPERPPEPPPVDAAVTRVEYDLRVEGESAVGEARLTVDILKQGWVRVDVPSGLLVRGARVDGRTVALVDQPAPHLLLSRVGRGVIALDVVLPLRAGAGTDTLTLPPSATAMARLALTVPRPGIDLTVSGGILAERPQQPQGRWVVFGRTGQPLTVMWKRRVEDARATQPLRWRGTMTQLIGLGEEASTIAGTVRVDVVQGLASAVEVAVPQGVAVNRVSGALVADWDFRSGVLRVNFLEPVGAQTTFSIAAEARAPRQGTIAVPLMRLPAAEREFGGVAVEVLGAGEIGDRQPRALDPADPSDLGEPLSGRESPSMVAFRFRPQRGDEPRALSVTVARYAPQAVLIANVEEARYDALLEEQGKTLVRARYAVRNNQRAFLGVRLPAGATLWSAAVANRPIRPGIAPDGSLLLPLEKGRAGGETPPFAVELMYVQRAAAWTDKGRAALNLPAIDLPIARTGLTLHHSPRFEILPQPGPFRTDADATPTLAVLSDDVHAVASPPPLPPPPPAAAPGPVADANQAAAFRAPAPPRAGVTGPLPVRVPFPDFGPRVFLRSELTAELQAPSLEFSYRRENGW